MFLLYDIVSSENTSKVAIFLECDKYSLKCFFVCQKIGKFWSNLLDNFIKHKSFISDEWHTLNKKEVFHPIKTICIHEAECFFSFYKKLMLISYIFALYNNPSAKLCSTWHKWQSFVFITKKALVVNAALATLFVLIIDIIIFVRKIKIYVHNSSTLFFLFFFWCRENIYYLFLYPLRMLA